MKDDLAEFLMGRTKACEEEVAWAGGTMRLQLSSYLADRMPPFDYVTSVRGIVLQEDTVLVVRYPDNLSILPGGRREEGEEIEETLHRELLEETGWEVGNPRLLGFKHFHHLTEKPEGYRYPYPVFLQLVYVTQALRCVSEMRLENGVELECSFCPIADAGKLSLSAGETVFLTHASRNTI